MKNIQVVLALIFFCFFFNSCATSPQGKIKTSTDNATANLEDGKAEYSLAEKYFKGEGVPHDDKKAAELYQKAAEQGYAKAVTGNLKMFYSWPFEYVLIFFHGFFFKNSIL